ncbi:Cyclin-D1-binding protein 1-like protein [Abortiporus biennis]
MIEIAAQLRDFESTTCSSPSSLSIVNNRHPIFHHIYDPTGVSFRAQIILTRCLIHKKQLSPSTTLSQEAPSQHPTNVLRKDYLSLLTLIYTTCTKVALTLRPAEPAHRAAIPCIQDLVKHVSAITTCATLFEGNGKTLAEDVKRYTKDVFESVNSFSRTFTSILENNSPSSSSATTGEEYLLRTGAVHAVVEKARQELPENNASAVKRRWSQDREMLEDSYADVTSMVEDSGLGDEEDEDFQDELDELGLGSSKKMSEEELERTRKIQPLLRIIVLLHKRVLLDVLKPASQSTSLETNPSLDALPSQSHSLLLTVEDLVAALYAPQKVSSIHAALESLVHNTRQLRSTLLEGKLLPEVKEQSLEQQMAGVSIGGSSSDVKKKDVRENNTS